MRQCQPQSLCNDLRRRRRAKKLTATSGRGAGSAAHVVDLADGDLAMGQARTHGLDLAGVFALFRGQRDAAGNDDDGQIRAACQRDQQCRQALVAGANADDTASSRQ